MATEVLPFACSEVVLLRSPVLPYENAEEARLPNLGLDPDESGLLTGYIRRLSKNKLLREAVELSSPSLSALVSEIGEDAAAPKLKALRSAALSLTRYQIRMATRPTPFGLLAGVAVARFGSSPKVRFGYSHSTVSRPDMEETTGGSWAAAENIAQSIMHMHCNRLMGIDRETEAQVLAIARGALRSHRDRARFAS